MVGDGDRRSEMKLYQVWHQNSPGIRVWVIRGFFGRLFRNKDFASVGETFYYQKPELIIGD